MRTVEMIQHEAFYVIGIIEKTRYFRLELSATNWFCSWFLFAISTKEMNHFPISPLSLTRTSSGTTEWVACICHLFIGRLKEFYEPHRSRRCSCRKQSSREYCDDINFVGTHENIYISHAVPEWLRLGFSSFYFNFFHFHIILNESNTEKNASW